MPATAVSRRKGDGVYDPNLKRHIVFELPDAPPVSDDEIELISRLFGDVIDDVLIPKDREP